MRDRLIICVVVTLTGVSAAGLATATAASSRTVKVGDNWFLKATDGVPKITVKRGTTVTFRFVGDSVHDVVGYRGGTKRFESPIKSSGTYKKKLSTAGRFKLICSIHGEDDQSMRITVTK